MTTDPKAYAGHTPGPWQAQWANSDMVCGYEIMSPLLPCSIALVPNINTPKGNGHANAALIAAAPDLLRENARLRDLLSRLIGYDIDGLGELAPAFRAALAGKE